MLVLSTQDFLWFVDQALDGMVAIVRGLGDQRVNTSPDLPGANSPCAIVTHCLGVIDFWGGAVIAGRRVTRDRDAEFRATGRVDDLVQRVVGARRQLEVDLASLDSSAPIRLRLPPEDMDTPFGHTQGGALVHLYEELTQHLGQLELTRDVLVADATPSGG